MHFFESPLVSTTKVLEQKDKKIIFSGHYRHGDGASLLCLPLFPIFLCLGIYFVMEGVGTSRLFAISLLCLPLLLHGLVFRKQTELRAAHAGVLIETQALLAKSKKEYPCSQVQLEVVPIHIRTASDCGAIDLVLPEGKIRLLVEGKYERALKKAESLSEFTGIALVCPPKTYA